MAEAPLCPSCRTPIADAARPACLSCGYTDGTNASDMTGAYVPTGNDAAETATFGNYELLEELGRGGMGVVYKARQKRADRLVALKVIRDSGAIPEAAKLRFTTEARALARISHPNIVAVYEVGEENGCPFFTMEFVEGMSLLQRVKSGSPLTEGEAAKIVEDLAGAVQAAHAVGVLHRDIKPANVLTGTGGTLKLSDFGLAKHLDQDTGLTIDGSALGTPSYMSPEQAAGDTAHLGPATDVYALGATLYELLAGRPPFRSDTAGGTLLKVLNEDVAPPGLFRKKLSRELEAICLKCLEKTPAKRYASAAGLADDLTRWRTGLSTVARPLSRPKRVWRWLRRRPARAALIVILLATMAALPWLLRERDPEVLARRDLQAGKPVTLIGPTGAPKHSRWLTAAPITGTPDPDKPFAVQSLGICLLELLDDPGLDRYRFTLEIRHTGIASGGKVGFYCARTDTGPADDRSSLLLGVTFLDLLAEANPQPDPRLHYSVSGFLLHNARFKRNDRLVEAPKWNRVANPKIGPWRKLIVEFRDGQFALFAAGETGELAVNSLHVSDNLLERADNLLAIGLRKLYGDPGFASRLSPRGGIGLLVDGSSAEFRNASVETVP